VGPVVIYTIYEADELAPEGKHPCYNARTQVPAVFFHLFLPDFCPQAKNLAE
jgi:hypothetical protein